MRVTPEEARVLAARCGVTLDDGGPKPSKMRNVPTEYAGRRYASKAEARRARELDALRQSGEVRFWIPQPIFSLGPAGIVYRPDFLVVPDRGGAWAEDVKGRETERFRLIKKVWMEHGPCDLRILRLVRGAWETETVIGGMA